jgi:hypothetical protein
MSHVGAASPTGKKRSALSALGTSPFNMDTKRQKMKESIDLEAPQPAESSQQASNVSSFPRGVCLKVTSLRPRYADLSVWMADESHVIVCRAGRVSLKSENGERRVLSYPASPWANPYKLSEYSLDESLSLFEKHLDGILASPEKLNEFMKLLKATEIGCFCLPGARCHRDIILNKLRQIQQTQSEAESLYLK